jgi:phosphoribosylformylglycinamidine cyclo-ligase
MKSSGLHSNGYSLARKVFLTEAGWELDRDVSDFGRTLGEQLLVPTAIYTTACLGLARDDALDVHAFSHITGGGIAANIARVMPEELHADIDRSTWQPHQVFNVLAELGKVDQPDMEQTFNMGLGMVAFVAPDSVPAALAKLARLSIDAWVVGDVRDRLPEDVSDAPAKGGTGGSVALVGAH